MTLELSTFGLYLASTFVSVMQSIITAAWMNPAVLTSAGVIVMGSQALLSFRHVGQQQQVGFQQVGQQRTNLWKLSDLWNRFGTYILIVLCAVALRFPLTSLYCLFLNAALHKLGITNSLIDQVGWKLGLSVTAGTTWVLSAILARITKDVWDEMIHKIANAVEAAVRRIAKAIYKATGTLLYWTIVLPLYWTIGFPATRLFERVSAATKILLFGPPNTNDVDHDPDYQYERHQDDDEDVSLRNLDDEHYLVELQEAWIIEQRPELRRSPRLATLPRINYKY